MKQGTTLLQDKSVALFSLVLLTIIIYSLSSLTWFFLASFLSIIFTLIFQIILSLYHCLISILQVAWMTANQHTFTFLVSFMTIYWLNKKTSIRNLWELYQWTKNMALMSLWTLSSHQCSICLNKQVDTQLHCGHYFHESCIDQWSRKGSECPNCRTNLGQFKYKGLSEKIRKRML